MWPPSPKQIKFALVPLLINKLPCQLTLHFTGLIKIARFFHRYVQRVHNKVWGINELRSQRTLKRLCEIKSTNHKKIIQLNYFLLTDLQTSNRETKHRKLVTSNYEILEFS